MVSGLSDRHLDALLSLHATVVGTASAAEAKRQNMSVISSGLISTGIAFSASNEGVSLHQLVLPFLIVSSIWFVTVRFYKKLAKAKWDVVHELEESLPFSPFKREWKLYKESKGRFSVGPSTLEQIIPGIILVMCFVDGLYLFSTNWLPTIL